MTPDLIDNATARRLFLHRHGLGTPPTGALTNNALAALIDALGFVQIDSINTVERAHHMILSARSTAYRPSRLRTLLERERALFEHWTHDAAVIPTRFYPHWHLRFLRDREKLDRFWPRWHGPEGLAEIDRILGHIEAHGPMLARDVAEGPPRASGGWWDWHPSKVALEYLWRTGALAVTRREGFQKVFDLSARVIPYELLASTPTHDETIDWACTTALDRLGFATAGEIAAFWKLVTPQEAAAWCAAGTKSGRLRPVTVAMTTGHRPRSGVVWPDTVAEAADLPPAPSRLRVLSPFDPALRDRNRAERLFGFHYRIEVFTPEAKRRFGYYVFPLLEGERLVGRVDMKAQREAAVLAVRALWPERGIRFGSGRIGRLEAELARVARFAGCETVSFADGWLRSPPDGHPI